MDKVEYQAVQIRLPKEVWKALRIRAIIQEKSLKDLCGELLEEALKRSEDA